MLRREEQHTNGREGERETRDIARCINLLASHTTTDGSPDLSALVTHPATTTSHHASLATPTTNPSHHHCFTPIPAQAVPRQAQSLVELDAARGAGAGDVDAAAAVAAALLLVLFFGEALAAGGREVGVGAVRVRV